MRKRRVITIIVAAVSTGFLGAWIISTFFLPVNADRLSGSIGTPTPSPSGLPLATPTPTDAPLGPGQTRVTLSIYQLKMVVTDPIGDLAYGAVDYYGSGTRKKAAGFTTESLLAKYPLCKPGALGTLYRKPHVGGSKSPSPSPTSTRSPKFTPNATPTPSPIAKNGFVKTVGDYDYYYAAPSSALLGCANDQFGKNAIVQAKASLMNAALPTLSQ